VKRRIAESSARGQGRYCVTRTTSSSVVSPSRLRQALIAQRAQTVFARAGEERVLRRAREDLLAHRGRHAHRRAVRRYLNAGGRRWCVACS